jgi:hypothetical protein
MGRNPYIQFRRESSGLTDLQRIARSCGISDAEANQIMEDANNREYSFPTRRRDNDDDTVDTRSGFKERFTQPDMNLVIRR